MRSTLKPLIAVGIASLALAPVAFAQAQKIAYVDYQRLLSESPQAKSATTTLEAEFGPKQKQLEAQSKEFEAKKQKFERDQATMAEGERTKAQRELRDQQLTLERRVKEFQEDGQMRQNEELHRGQKMIVEPVRGYAKAQGYALAIAQGVTYSSH